MFTGHFNYFVSCLFMYFAHFSIGGIDFFNCKSSSCIKIIRHMHRGATIRKIARGQPSGSQKERPQKNPTLLAP